MIVLFDTRTYSNYIVKAVRQQIFSTLNGTGTWDFDP